MLAGHVEGENATSGVSLGLVEERSMAIVDEGDSGEATAMELADALTLGETTSVEIVTALDRRASPRSTHPAARSN